MGPAAWRTLVVPGCALLGLLIGSFLNVVVYRLPRGMSLAAPASHCPGCSTPLAWFDNVPVVSWLALRGRCRTCGTPISARYPLVELGTAAGFAATAAAVGAGALLVPLMVVVAGAIVSAMVELDRLPLPAPVGVALALGAGGLLVLAVADGRPDRLGWAALGAATTGAVGYRVEPIEGRRPGGRQMAAASLGWCAGWLWPIAGILTAAWLAGIVLLARAGARTAHAPGTVAELRPRHPRAGRQAERLATSGAAVMLTGLALLLVAAGVGA